MYPARGGGLSTGTTCDATVRTTTYLGSCSPARPTNTGAASHSSAVETPPVTSGNDLRVDRRLMRKTANHRLISARLAYPTFYSKLYVDLRQELTKQATAARQGSGKGLFAQDRT